MTNYFPSKYQRTFLVGDEHLSATVPSRGELRTDHREHRLAFQISPPWSGGYSEAAVVSREWKFISKNHYTLYHSIPHEH